MPQEKVIAREAEINGRYIIAAPEEYGAAGSMRKRRMIIIVFALVLLIIVCAAAGIYSKIRIGGDDALRDARNVRIAMRAAAIEIYGMNASLYDASAINGLSKRAESEIRTLSGADGDIILNAWDVSDMEPVSFIYRNDGYTVYYSRDTGTEENSWKVYYSLLLSEY